MTEPRPVLLTGAAGRLGRELVALFPDLGLQPLLTPDRGQLDITNGAQALDYLAGKAPRLVVHAAAFTDVVAAESQRERAWATNVEGTRHVAAAARSVGARLLHISTDYVFSGQAHPAGDDAAGEGLEDRPGGTAAPPAHESGGERAGTQGRYSESHAPGPVTNYYALTKLVAEEAARAAPGSLVLRTSFRAREWPYERAFDDMFTSQDYVDVIAPLVAEVAVRFDLGQVPFDTLHVGTERKSVYELARRRAPAVTRAARASAGVALPYDVSLDLSRWLTLRAGWR